MILATPHTITALGHRALHVAAADSGHVVALSKEGIGSLIAPDHLTMNRFELSFKVAGAAISPEGKRLALLEQTAMSLVALPDLVEEFRVEDIIESCMFSSSGAWLWSASHDDNDTAVLEVRDSKTGDIIVRTEVPDPFGSSSLMLFRQPNEECVSMWVAAGQDGQCLYWGHYDGSKLTAQRFPDLTETTPPGFDRSGRRFLVVSDGSVRLYEHPRGPELGRLVWPLENDPPAETVAFIGDGHAIVHSGNGRLFLIGLQKMQIAEEISIRGHEPRPVHELYPNLPRDQELCSDLSTFLPLPSGEFLSIHRELPSASISDWRDQLITWKIPHS
jgi:hypothetical protein